jgi:hypothetical protein
MESGRARLRPSLFRLPARTEARPPDGFPGPFCIREGEAPSEPLPRAGSHGGSPSRQDPAPWIRSAAHSNRSALTGCSRAARSAGQMLARTAIRSAPATIQATVNGSMMVGILLK